MLDTNQENEQWKRLNGVLRVVIKVAGSRSSPGDHVQHLTGRAGIYAGAVFLSLGGSDHDGPEWPLIG